MDPGFRGMSEPVVEYRECLVCGRYSRSCSLDGISDAMRPVAVGAGWCNHVVVESADDDKYDDDFHSSK